MTQTRSRIIIGLATLGLLGTLIWLGEHSNQKMRERREGQARVAELSCRTGHVPVLGAGVTRIVCVPGYTP